MQIVVLASVAQRAELQLDGEATGVVFVEDETGLLQHRDADAFVDLAYTNNPERNAFLSQLLPGLVLVNSVVDALAETNPAFVRINGWNTFLSGPVIEAAALDDAVKQKAVAVFAAIGKQVEWLPDELGFVSARVVSMIVNEAFLALEEGVSTKEEINTAMKLGTAYPFGPFEWAEKIGVRNVAALLQALSKTQTRYIPAAGLLREAGLKQTV